MKFEHPLQEGKLVRRYKRFMADVEHSEDKVITIHCPNTGSMKNCSDQGSRVWFWDSGNPKRKYPHSWELVEVEEQFLACVNTGRANALTKEAINNAIISELQGYESLRTEVKYGEEGSRIDLLLEGPQGRCYVEVKNVTLLREDGLGVFPDAVTERGRKHLRELMKVAAAGDRAVLLYCVAHTGIERVSPADDLDPAYGETLREAVTAGVEIYAYRAEIDSESISLRYPIEVCL
ncbi:DNA/RNA nuclease SfsA [Motiliproteus sp. MSK22-1]|uniref:DNA/RNA nuclease SfsA n=1 Tax=Motiliproteus sp. MSK22-1 TaxID=1897630 RepID=UPI0009784841|nr:DNA/RNA nuclease SfsA [Motiliproteus sp. MSK22-1]OMH32051.1 sugar fermentation stimulation protein SfsA [Motiliproteus sp. MSK22-1]